MVTYKDNISSDCFEPKIVNGLLNLLSQLCSKLFYSY